MKYNRNKALIWKGILDYALHYTSQSFNKEDLSPDTKILSLFPSQPEKLNDVYIHCDEDANRFGMMLFDCLMYYRLAFDLPGIKIDYELRKEFEIFQNLQDVFNYFEALIIQHKGVI